MRKGAVIAIIIIVVLIICGVVGFVIYDNSQNDITTTSTTQSAQKSGAGLGFEDDQSGIVKTVENGVAAPGWDKMTIDAGKTEVYVDFYNPESNEGKYFMTYELYLTDTGEKLAETKMIKPGDHIKKITLTRPLEAGTYSAYVHIQPYYADSLLATNNVDMKFTLVVQ